MRVTKETRQEMVLTGGGGVVAAFGMFLAFMAGGGLYHAAVSAGNSAARLAVAIPAVLFFAAGFLMIFYRHRIELNRVTEKAENWWGFWPSIKLSVTGAGLSDAGMVRIDRVVTRSGKSNKTSYPVILSGNGNDYRLISSFHYMESRRVAEAVARFWGVPLHDRSEGTLIMRDAGSLDESMADRARGRGDRQELPPEPENSIASGTDDGKTLTINIPATGFTMFHKIMALAVGSLLLFFVLPDFLKVLWQIKSLPDLERFFYPLMSPFNFILIALELVIVQSAMERIQITATADRVRVLKAGVISRWAMKMKSSEIEEFFAAPGFPAMKDERKDAALGGRGEEVRNFFLSHSRLIARGDKRAVKVFIPVTLPEAEYIAAIVARRLSGLG